MLVILAILLLTITTPVMAQCKPYFVVIDKVGHVDKGQEAGQTEKGDVIGIFEKYEQSKKADGRYLVKKMCLTETQKTELTEDVVEEVTEWTAGVQRTFEKTVRARKRKIDYKKLSEKQNEEITNVSEKVITKSDATTVTR